MKKDLNSYKKILKSIAIILSIILLILDICLYIKMKSGWSDIGYNKNKNITFIIVIVYRYSILIWGILSIGIVWIEYFLVKLFMIIYNKLYGLKKFILSIILLAIIIAILILFIKIILQILMTLI